MAAAAIKVIPVKLTAQQKRNLTTLADGLAKLRSRERFDMAQFADDDIKPADLTPDCGAVCCACGWGPRFGIKAKHGEDWYSYAARAFGVVTASITPAWSWCFSAPWYRTDNTPQGAAARIRWMLKHGGVPKNHYDQCDGYAPLCYRKGGK